MRRAMTARAFRERELSTGQRQVTRRGCGAGEQDVKERSDRAGGKRRGPRAGVRADPSRTAPLDLGPAGLALVLQAPEGATARFVNGSVQVEAPRFHMEITPGRADLAVFKENLKD